MLSKLFFSRHIHKHLVHTDKILLQAIPLPIQRYIRSSHAKSK